MTGSPKESDENGETKKSFTVFQSLRQSLKQGKEATGDITGKQNELCTEKNFAASRDESDIEANETARNEADDDII